MPVDWSKVPPPAPPREPVEAGGEVDWSKVPPPEMPASATAYSAQGMDPDAARKALTLSKTTGLQPAYLAGNLGPVVAAQDTARFSAELAEQPDIKAWADQSAAHAAAVKGDMGPLGRIADWLRGTVRGGATSLVQGGGVSGAVTQGFVDLAHAEAMREYMNGGTGFGARSALNLERLSQQYEAGDHNIGEDIARAAPQMTTYGLVGFLGGGVGLAGLMYAQNKGVLARQIQAAQPREGGLSANEVDNYATAGSAVAAVTLAGLLGPLVKSLPGVRERIAGLTGDILARGISTTTGQAAMRALGAWGKHTIAGALGMALQGTINKGTVQKSLGNDLHYGDLAADTMHDFVKVLPVAATFAAWGPGRDFLAERGQIALAGGDAAKLNDMVEQAKKSQLVKASPDIARELFGAIGDGLRNVYIDYKAAQKLRGRLPPTAVAEAEATQGSVPMPIADYLSTMSDAHEGIKDDVKLDPEGMTPREAQARDAEMRQALSPEEARALYGRMTPDELQGLDLPPIGDATPRVVDALQKSFEGQKENSPTTPARPGNVPDTAVSRPLHETMADEFGGMPEEWAKRLTPELLTKLTGPAEPGIDHAAAAEKILAGKPLGEIQPGRYALDAQRAGDKLTQQAIKSADLASKRGQEGNAVVSRAKETELTSARDLARALADKAAEVRAKYDKRLAAITGKAGESNFRDALRRADAGRPGLDTVFKALVDSLSGAADPDPAALDALPDVLERMQNSNTPVAFDTAALTRLLARGRSWETLTQAEADHVGVVAKNLRAAARNELSILRQDLNDAANTIRSEAAALPKVDTPLVADNASWWKRVTSAPAAFNARALERLAIIKSLGETMKKLVVDRYYACAEKEDQLSRSVMGKFDAAQKAMPEEMRAARFNPVQMPDELAAAYQRRGLTPNADRKLIWSTALMWGDGQARQRYVAGMGVPEQLVNNWLVDNMSAKEWAFLKDYSASYGELWPELKAKEERKSGVAPEASKPAPIYDRDGNKLAEGWYFPLARDRRAFTTDGGAQPAGGPQSPADLFGPNYTRPAVQHQFVKERSSQAAYVVDLNWDRIASHIGQVIHDIAFDEFVTDTAKLMMHPEVDAAMKERLGMEKRDQARAWLYVAANERAEAAQSLGALGKVFTFLRNRTQSSALGNSMPVMAAMATHSIVSLVHGEVRARGAVDYVKAISPDVEKFAMENSEALRQRATSGKRALQEDMRLLGDRFADSLAGKGLDLAARVAQFGQDFMDRKMGVGLWTAKYNEALAGGASHEEASKAGDAMVRENLQPREPAEKSALMNDKGALSAILIFHGFFNKVYNKTAEFAGPAADAWSTRTPMPENVTPGDTFAEMQAAQARKDRTAAAWKTAEASGKFLALMGVLGLGKLALGHGREDGESWAQWGLRTAGGAAADIIPFLSNLTQPILDKIISGKTRPVDFRSAPAFAGLQKFTRSVEDAATDGKSDRVWKAVDAGVMAAGAGSSQYVRTAKYLTGPRSTFDADRGKVGSMIHGAVYGEQNRSETLPLLLQNLIEGK